MTKKYLLMTLMLTSILGLSTNAFSCNQSGTQYSAASYNNIANVYTCLNSGQGWYWYQNTLALSQTQTAAPHCYEGGTIDPTAGGCLGSGYQYS